MIPRRVLDSVRRALARQAATALLGPRQVGKTTLAREIARTTRSLYLDLQSRADRNRLTDPRLFLRSYEDRLVILDEIHRVPELFPELRGLIDEGRQRGRRTGRFLILGSASVDLLKQAGESLAGRIEFVSLNPLDVLEAAPDDPAMTSLWVRGGFPDSFLAQSDEDSLAYRQNFIRTYLERDLAEFIQMRIPSETLARLWTMLAHDQGGMLTIAKLARSLAISAPAVTRYVDVLAGLLLVRRLPPFAANVRKRLVKSPKVYIRGSGLLHALLDIESFHALAGHSVVGASWEGFVIENLLAAAHPLARASFYRTAAGAEIDLVLEVPRFRRPLAIEIRRGLSPSLGKGFRSAYADLAPERAFVVYAGSERYPVAESVEVIGLPEMARMLADPAALRS
ncbi:MAG: ATP-binding protein [Gemmatimonadetes bacterium]|nr:ATP-binding protein [Gemmatimonadota bacterium]MCY3943915.1 ATP-binding protein [Gemmatimonadota bacterium]